MKDARTASVVAAITARFPGTTVEFRINPAPGMPTIPEFLCVLDVPPSQTHAVTAFALDVAFAAFGDDQPPFLVWALDPEQSARVFPRGAIAEQVSEP